MFGSTEIDNYVDIPSYSNLDAHFLFEYNSTEVYNILYNANVWGLNISTVCYGYCPLSTYFDGNTCTNCPIAYCTYCTASQCL